MIGYVLSFVAGFVIAWLIFRDWEEDDGPNCGRCGGPRDDGKGICEACMHELRTGGGGGRAYRR